MIKRNTITKILEQFCKFDRNIFTFDLVGNTTQYFLDINMASDGLAIYTKDTFTRQYTNFESFVLWQYKVSWVRERIDRVHQMCTPNKIKTEIILKEIFWNFIGKSPGNEVDLESTEISLFLLSTVRFSKLSTLFALFTEASTWFNQD